MIIKRLQIRDLELHQSDFEIMIKASSVLSFPHLYIDDNYVIWQLKSLKDHLEKQDAIVFVAEDNDMIEGFIWCHEIIRISEKRLHISHFCVKEQFRNKGIGSSLMKEVKKYADDSDYSGIDLMVTATNANAVQFYEHNGFHIERYLMNQCVGDNISVI